jgi:hypothetical protein
MEELIGLYNYYGEWNKLMPARNIYSPIGPVKELMYVVLGEHVHFVRRLSNINC